MSTTINPDEYYNRLISDTLDLCEDFECPQSFQLFAMLGTVSALLGKRNYLRIGTEQIRANLGLLFCAPPAVKRAPAINLIHSLLDGVGYNKVLPDNLGNAKTSGLVMAMLRPVQEDMPDFVDDDSDTADMGFMSLPSLPSVSPQFISTMPSTVSPSGRDTAGGLLTGGQRGKQALTLSALSAVLDKQGSDLTNAAKARLSGKPVHSAAVLSDNMDTTCERTICTNDLVSLLNGAPADTYALLSTLWDGTTYRMKHRKNLLEVIDPCLTFLASLTPVGLMDTFPETAVGTSFLSRCIIIYDDHNAKSCPYPKGYNPLALMRVNSALANANTLSQEFTMTPDAQKVGATLYSTDCLIDDSRFFGYWDLRHTHLHKLAMCLAAYEGRTTITANDITDAHRLLSTVEDRMIEGIGEYGNTKIAVGRQKCLDILRSACCMEKEKFRARCSSYLFTKDIDMFISDMIVQGKFIQEVTDDGKLMLVFNVAASIRKKSVASESVLAATASHVSGLPVLEDG